MGDVDNQNFLYAKGRRRIALDAYTDDLAYLILSYLSVAIIVITL